MDGSGATRHGPASPDFGDKVSGVCSAKLASSASKIRSFREARQLDSSETSGRLESSEAPELLARIEWAGTSRFRLLGFIWREALSADEGWGFVVWFLGSLRVAGAEFRKLGSGETLDVELGVPGGSGRCPTGEKAGKDTVCIRTMLSI